MKSRWFLLVALLLSAPALAEVEASGYLSLAQAEQLALERDASVRSLRSEEHALWHESTAAGALPDPTLSLGLTNVPTDSFRLDQDPMTQTQIGLRQPLPRGEKRRLQSARYAAQARMEGARARERERAIRRDVRKAYLELAHARRALEILASAGDMLDALLERTERDFASGGGTQQTVIRARVERERLEDRVSRWQAEAGVARAEMERWVGSEPARKPIKVSEVTLPMPTGRETVPVEHPALAVQSERVRLEQERVGLAREAYRPDFGVELRYGYRGSTLPGGADAPDLASLMVTMDLPIFPGRRQDPQLEASQYRLAGARYSRDDAHTMLNERLAGWRARYERLEERRGRYAERLLPAMEEGYEAAFLAWRSGKLDFSDVIRARLDELDTRLEAARVASDVQKARAELLYLEGGYQ